MSCLVAVLMAGVALAQEPQATIRVEVTASSVPIAGATVAIGGKPTRTDSRGIAAGPAPFGTVQVKITKEGFLPATASLQVTEAREWGIAVELTPLETVKEEITVSATRTDARLQDLPTRVEVLDEEEIQEKMMMTPGDIVMMLNEMGGMRVQTTSPSLGAASVRIQGMSGRYTRFLSDGLPLFGQQGAGLGLLQVPPTDLAQVEVIKGASSALYGAGAVAGVVNLVSRRPGAEPVHEFLINRSTLGATDASAFLASRLSPHWGASFLGSGDWQERRDIDGDGWADLAGYGRGVARPRLFWDDGHGRTGFLTGGATYEDRAGGTMDGASLPATGTPYTESLVTRRYDLGGSGQMVLQDRYVVSARFAVSDQQHDHGFGEIRERDSHELLFGEATIRGASGRHTWVAGAAAEREAYRAHDVPRFSYTYVTPGVFAQDDVRITPWLSLSGSVRADFQDRYGTFFSPRLAALLRWSGWTSRLSVGQGFSTPSPLTEETEAAGLSRLSVPVPLVPERGRTASFDLSRSVGPVSATATMFASTVRRPIRVERDGQYELTNLPQPASNVGMELLGTWRKAPFSATVSYTYVDSRERGEETPLTPRQSFGIVGMWENANGRFGVECYYTGRQRLEDNPYRDYSEPYISTGFLAERKVWKLRLFLNAENLANVRQTRWDPLLRPNRGADGRWTVDAWAPLEGRVFNGGVRFVF